MIMETIKRLQNDAVQFLTKSNLVVNGVVISPKEIEVYYYEVNGSFKDGSVHRNELQKNNKNHFYVHRWGITKNDKYKGVNRAGLDLVISDNENVYYSYLIRSAVIGDNLVVGPNKVLNAIKDICKCLDYKELENTFVKLEPNGVSDAVLFSNRINLGENAGKYSDYKLRAVICDDLYRESKYPAKEKMVMDFLLSQKMAKEDKQKYAKEKLGYVPSAIK